MDPYRSAPEAPVVAPPRRRWALRDHPLLAWSLMLVLVPAWLYWAIGMLGRPEVHRSGLCMVVTAPLAVYGLLRERDRRRNLKPSPFFFL